MSKWASEQVSGTGKRIRTNPLRSALLWLTCSLAHLLMAS